MPTRPGDPSVSLQERYAPGNICYGRGPSNPRGLHIHSFPQGDEVVCELELVRRLPAAGLLPNEPALIERIVQLAPRK